MDKNDTKLNLEAANSNLAVRPESSAHHQMLLDRLTKRPAAVAAQLQGVETPTASVAPAIAQAHTPRAAEDERRASPRRRMLKAGVMAFNGSFASLRCTVRDLSETGAHLKVDQLVKLPETFELIIEIDGLYAKSRVVWRKGSDLGVRFLEPARTGAKLRTQVITPRT